MFEWVLIAVVVTGGLLAATHAAGVVFVVGRIVFSGRPKQRQWSPRG